MKKKIHELMALNIKLEKTVGELYRRYAELFPEDHLFWEKLFREEIEHANLLEQADYNKDKEIAGAKTVYKHYDATIAAIDEINGYIAKTQHTAPTLREACDFALHLESSASEFHLQYMIKKSTGDELLGVFKQLNSADESHVRRISEFMREKKL